MPAALETRLREALVNTSEAPPRPLGPVEAPPRLKRWLTPAVLKSLRPAAVLVPVVRQGRGLNVLLTRRSEALRLHKGQISFPGGRREASDASALATALREAHEEVGLAPSAVEVLGYLDDYPTLTRYRVTPVVGLVASATQVKPCVREVAEVFEVPLPFLLNPKNFKPVVFSVKGLKLSTLELHYERYRIWGATAGMLWNLAQKMDRSG
ncbi:MAG: CoA pyrophosphatase [Nevskiales bacterium]|nr:CoA pyrophosphatase [Nevskiales bacterium]